MILLRYIVAIALPLFIPHIAHAYVGPGIGAGAIAAVLGIIGSIFAAIFAIVYYPIKRALKKRKQNSEKSDHMPTE